MPTSLHMRIGKIVEDLIIEDCKSYLSNHCGGAHQISLYSGDIELCRPDIIISKKGRIRAIIEIEQTRNNPVRLFGKVFSPGLAQYSSIKNIKDMNMGSKVLFIQILRNVKSTKNKEKQCERIAKWLEETLPSIKGCCISRYSYFIGEVEDFKPGEKIYNEFEKILKEELK